MFRLAVVPLWRVRLILVWIPDKTLLRGPTGLIGFGMLSSRLLLSLSSLSSSFAGLSPSAGETGRASSLVCDVVGFVVTINGRGCREQMSLVSTPADRNKAQNNWAPTSRDPSSSLAAARKSLFCIGSSRSLGS